MSFPTFQGLDGPDVQKLIMPSKMEVASHQCETVPNKTKDILDIETVETVAVGTVETVAVETVETVEINRKV